MPWYDSDGKNSWQDDTGKRLRFSEKVKLEGMWVENGIRSKQKVFITARLSHLQTPYI